MSRISSLPFKLPFLPVKRDDTSVPLFRRPLPPALICALLWGSAFPAIKHVYGFWAGYIFGSGNVMPAKETSMKCG